MVIQDSAVNIKFSKVDNIKKKYILNEDILNGFNEPTILPIPDEAPTDIPRIIITSREDYLRLNIAPEAISMQTQYTGDYAKDWKKCEEYIKNKGGDVINLTEKIIDGNYKYIGIITNIIWDDIKEDGAKKLYKNLLNKEAAENLNDFIVKYTFVENEKYFVNITLQSVRRYKTNKIDVAGNLTNENMDTHTIGVTLDINDRYSFNTKCEYKSSKEVYEEILDLTTEIINNKIKKIVEKGEY